MVVVPNEFRSDEGVSHMRLTGNLVATLGMQGVNEFSVDPERWEAGIEAAIQSGQEQGMKFNFVLMHENHLHHHAHHLGILYPTEKYGQARYESIFQSEAAARNYLRHFVKSAEEERICVKMGERFLEKFDNPFSEAC